MKQPKNIYHDLHRKANKDDPNTPYNRLLKQIRESMPGAKSMAHANKAITMVWNELPDEEKLKIYQLRNESRDRLNTWLVENGHPVSTPKRSAEETAFWNRMGGAPTATTPSASSSKKAKKEPKVKKPKTKTSKASTKRKKALSARDTFYQQYKQQHPEFCESFKTARAQSAALVKLWGELSEDQRDHFKRLASAAAQLKKNIGAGGLTGAHAHAPATEDYHRPRAGAVKHAYKLKCQAKEKEAEEEKMAIKRAFLLKCQAEEARAAADAAVAAAEAAAKAAKHAVKGGGGSTAFATEDDDTNNNNNNRDGDDKDDMSVSSMSTHSSDDRPTSDEEESESDA